MQRRAKLFAVVPHHRTRGNEYKLGHRRFQTQESVVDSAGDWSVAQVAQRGCGISFLEDTQKSSGLGPEQPALGVSGCAGRLDQVTSRSPFQPQPAGHPVLATKIHPTVFESINLHFNSSWDNSHLRQSNRKKKNNLKGFLNCFPYIQTCSSYKCTHSNHHLYLGLNKESALHS